MANKIEKFEDLDVWKESMRLSILLYKSLKPFRDFSLKNQMERPSVSIPSNIAEGYERNSNKEFIQYLYIAKGSCGELRTQLYLAMKTDQLEKTVAEELLEATRKISAMLAKLIKVRQDNFG